MVKIGMPIPTNRRFNKAAFAVLAALAGTTVAQADDRNVTPEAMAPYAGMPVIYFDPDALMYEGRGIGFDFTIAGGAGLDEVDPAVPSNERLAELGNKYTHMGWVIKDSAGRSHCAMVKPETDNPLAQFSGGSPKSETMDRLVAAYACAANGQGATLSAGGYTIWPQAFLKAADTARTMFSFSETDIDVYAVDLRSEYLETYYLELSGRPRDQHCRAVYGEMNDIATNVMGALDRQASRNPAAYENIVTGSLDKKGYANAVIYGLLRASEMAGNGLYEELKGKTLRGYADRQESFVACPS